MKKVFIVFILYFTCGCSGDDNTVPSAETPAAAHNDSSASVPANLAGCYRMTIEKDTAFLELKQEGDSLYGPLVYKRFEKDSNTGTVRMKLLKGLANGWYVFHSEGKSSVRQIIFQASDSSLAEGYGDIEMKGDSACFKYPHALRFEEKHLFVKMACK